MDTYFTILAFEAEDLRQARKTAEAMADMTETTIMLTMEDYAQEVDNDGQIVVYTGLHITEKENT